MRRKLFFVTSNPHKVEEVKQFFPEIQQLNIELKEIRSDSFEEIAKAKLQEALEKIDEKNAIILVEDAGLEIEALNGFPGTYSAWVYKKIGCEGILKLMKDEKNRKAKFVAVVSAYIPDNEIIITTKGETEGYITEEKRGNKGFGYDPIFVPYNYPVTFAEDPVLKNKLSHRLKAWTKMKKKLTNIL